MVLLLCSQVRVSSIVTMVNAFHNAMFVMDLTTVVIGRTNSDQNVVPKEDKRKLKMTKYKHNINYSLNVQI